MLGLYDVSDVAEAWPLFGERARLLKLTLVLITGASVYGLWLGYSVIGPLERLQRNIERHMQIGRTGSLALDRRDEIGLLSRDFEQLAKRLEARAERTAATAADFAHAMKSPIAAIEVAAENLESLSTNDALNGHDSRDGRDGRDGHDSHDGHDGRNISETRNASGPPPSTLIAHAIARAAQHLDRSVDGLLTLARLDEELIVREREVLSLLDLVKNLAASYGPRLAAEANARASHQTAPILDIQVEGQPVSLLGQAARIEEAIANLIENAIVFARSTIRIEVVEEISSAGDRYATVFVEDDGPGVGNANRHKIFERFFSWRPAEAEPGKGLGLAIATAIAEAHGGDLSLCDASVLGGARFRLRFAMRVVVFGHVSES